MESITNQKGMLSLELGTSWISLNEAAALEKGDTIRLNSFTGIPHRLMFNNLFLGSCEIVILDDILGARITDFVRRPERASPGNKSSLTSLLPLAVRIGAASYFLEELEGLIPGSIISLDCPYRERTEAVLYAGGIKTAEGTVVSLYENYGLRIEKTLFPPSERQEKEDPGFASRIIKAEMESGFCREYDFRRPDKISRNGIEKIHDIHRNFLKYLINRNPSLQNWSVSYVAKLALYEITGDLDR